MNTTLILILGKIFGRSAQTSAYLLLCVIYSAPVMSFDFDREIVLKSGFIYNFARLSEGNDPQINSGQYFICSQDDDFLLVSSKVLEGKKVKGLGVIAKKVTSINEVEGCNVLFISKRYFPVWETHFLTSALKNTMLIGEDKGFLQSGGHINFFLLSGKVRFEVSLPNLQRSGFHLSSKVLRLGRVHGDKDHE